MNNTAEILFSCFFWKFWRPYLRGRFFFRLTQILQAWYFAASFFIGTVLKFA